MTIASNLSFFDGGKAICYLLIIIGLIGLIFSVHDILGIYNDYSTYERVYRIGFDDSSWRFSSKSSFVAYNILVSSLYLSVVALGFAGTRYNNGALKLLSWVTLAIILIYSVVSIYDFASSGFDH